MQNHGLQFFSWGWQSDLTFDLCFKAKQNQLTKSTSHIIGPTGLKYESNLQEIMGCESFGLVRINIFPQL